MQIKGVVENIIFRNEDNGYTVLLVNTGKTAFTIVGEIYRINNGDTISADVTEYKNENYGKQYKINSYNISIPEDEVSIVKFLTTTDFKGVGKATVKRIVDIFGKDTIDVIMNHKDKLYGIKGVTEVKIKLLQEKISERYSELDIILYLEKYKLGSKLIKNIIDVYGDKTLEVIKEDPYQMALNVEGVGFVICDNIAKVNGYDVNSEKRVTAGIIYVLENAHIEGNIFIEKNQLLNDAKKILSLKDDYCFDDILYNLQINLRIVIKVIDDLEYVFLKKVFNVEKNLTNLLLEKKDDILIITGGPGTGKTYNIKHYLETAREQGLQVELCAPTGRAAKRIEEVTRHEAKTIHRLLECIGQDDGHKSYFNRNEDNPLECDMLIVDEMSMVDEYLMYSLMKAVPTMVEIILVGDVDQLPSVGAGQVLKDMIDSGFFKVKKLDKIYRQGEGSNIVKNAHLVNEGKKVDFDNNSEDFKFIHISTEEKIQKSITKLVSENIPKYFGIGMDQMQVICPSKKGNCGTESLNQILQAELNPEDYTKNELKIGSIILRIGDKVMQTTNNYSIPYDCFDEYGDISNKGSGVFNGDIGEIIEIDEKNRKISIKYDDRIAYYESKDLIDLTLAYAITVHKSQGSEYDVVIMPMSYAPNKLLNRKILYTAMTRAKKCICFVGLEKFFYVMMENESDVIRNSALCSNIYES